MTDKDRLDGLFGEGFTESTKVNKKDVQKADKNISKAERQQRKEYEKAQKETDKAFIKSEKERVKRLNKAIDKGEGLIDEDGYLMYRAKEKFTKESIFDKEPSVKLTRTRPHGLFNFLINILKWFRTKLIPAITGLFTKNRTKSVEYVGDETQNRETDKGTPELEKNQTVEKDTPILSEPVKLLYTSPLLNNNIQPFELPSAPDNIVQEYLDFTEKQGINGNEHKQDIVYYIASKLTMDQPISEQNLSDMAKFLTDFDCKFDSQTLNFLFTIDTADGQKGLVVISDNGEVLVPDYMAQGDIMVENPLKGQGVSNENLLSFAVFLRDTPNYIRAIVTENSISTTDLNVVKGFIEDYPELKTMDEAIKEFEENCQDPDVYRMINKTMARMTYIDNVYPETIFEYGFSQPARIIPELTNPKDYDLVLKATQHFVANGVKLADAYSLSDVFIIDATVDKQPMVITDKSKLEVISNHIDSLSQRGIHPPLINNLIKTYNGCADERSMRIAVESIDSQLNNKKFINEVIMDSQTVNYTDAKIAEDISNALKDTTIKNLSESYKNGETTEINNYIKALSFDELIEISGHLSAEDRMLFNQVVSATKGEPEQIKEDAGDAVLNGNGLFITDGNHNAEENEFFRNFNNDEQSK